MNWLQDSTPVEAWSGFKPSAEHLKMFRVVGYAHVPGEITTKLDDRAIKTVFLSYKKKKENTKFSTL